MALPSYYKFWQPNTDLNFDTDIMSGYKGLNSGELGLDSNKPALPTKLGLGSVLGIAGSVAGGLMDLYQGLNADTSEIDNAVDKQIDALGNLKYNKADSIDELMANQSAYRGLEANHTADEFYKGPSDGEIFTNALAKGASSALSTSSAGPIASAISGGFGFLGSLAGGLFGRKAKRRAASAGASEINTEERRKNAYMDLAFRNNASNINTINNRTLMSQVGIAAYGGPLGVSLTPVNGAIDFMQNEELLSSLGEDTTKNNNKRVSMPMFAFGGALGGYGGDWSNGLNFIKAGGTHGENPIGGVPIGVAQDGMPNLVEEGEVVWNDYVFSNRINVPKETMERLGIKGKDTMTFAEAVEKVQKSSAERPNDPIEKRGLDAVLAGLMQKQEEIRQSKAEEEQFNEMEDMAAFAADGGPIHIAKNKKGTFTAAATKHGMGVQEFAGHVLANKDKYSSAMVKKANFARNASKWHHALGGYLFDNGGPKDRIKKAMVNSDRQPVHGTWNGLYDWMIENRPLVQQFPTFGGFGGAESFGGSGASGEWGDVDYIRNVLIPPTTETFDEAFARHRKAGDKTFWFNGELKSTEIDPNYKGSPNSQRTQVVTPAMNQRDIFTNTGERMIDSTKIEPYYGQPQGYTERETLAPNKVKYKYIGSSPFKALGGHLFDDGGLSDSKKMFYHDYTPLLGEDTTFNPGGVPYMLNFFAPKTLTSLYPNNSMFKTSNNFGLGYAPLTADLSTNYSNTGITSAGNSSNISSVTGTGVTNGVSTERDLLPTSGWQTGLRYLPAIAPAISLGYSLFKKPDYGYADELDAAGNAYAEAIREGGKVTPKFIGDYLAYNPFDRIFYANELGAQQAANRSAIMNAGNANRGATMAALLGSGYNDNVGLGKLFREGDEYNLAQRQKVAEFNRGTNQYNSTLDMQAQEINARKNERLAAALLENKYRSLAMKQAIDNQRDQSISLALTNLFNNLGDIGWEAKQGYWNNALINSGIWGTPNASMYDIAYGAAKGGKLNRKKKKGLTI